MLYIPSSFSFYDAALWVEDMPASALAAEFGTPLYVYSKAAICAAVQAYKQALVGRQAQIYYSLKANPSLALVQLLGQLGCGADIMSLGELERAVVAGIAPQQVVFSGVGKSTQEMERALELGIACFNVESVPELQRLDTVARTHGVQAPISLRVNPDVDAQTHPYISTGLKVNKFGIAHSEALATYQDAVAKTGLRVEGIDCHIGSQIISVDPYVDTVERVLDLVEQIEAQGISLRHIDLGGGLGIRYHDETPPVPGALLAAIFERIDARGFSERHVRLEPGRSLVGNAGVCLTEVLYLKQGVEKNFCIVDAAMNDLPRPAMYQGFHAIAPVGQSAEAKRRYDVVGPVCESGDWIGRERDLAVAQGEYLAVFSAGAYCKSMASNYNSRVRAAEVLVDGTQTHLIGARETLQALFANERLL